MDAAQTALLTSGITVALAGAVGYGLYRLVNVAVPKTASDWGRKWLSWCLFLSSISQLPSFFLHLDANSFAVWVLISVVLGVAGFSFGWLYGRFYKLRSTDQTTKELTFKETKNTSLKVDDRFYQIAWKEVQVNRVNEGLWAKAYAQAEGNETRAKAIYLQTRANQLKERERNRIAETQAQKRKEAVSSAATYILNVVELLFLVLALFSILGILSAVIMII
jgi:hypothetical protein